MTPIKKIATGLRVEELHTNLLALPQLWNANRQRTRQYEHSEISDIWVRCAEDPLSMRGEEPVECVWYPAAVDLPGLELLVWPVLHFVQGERLGGILITKIPPGKSVLPHVDRGWHANYYDKFAVQIAANEQQAFCFESLQLISKPGDLYTFDNSQTHWVTNDSEEDRITLILCIKTRFAERRVRS